MNKKVLVIILILVVLLVAGIVFVGGSSLFSDSKTNEDAIKFKEEYESLNREVNTKYNKEYRTLSIPKDNPFVYKSADDIVEMIDKGETFVVYFGFNTCPWCRSVVPSLMEAANDLEIDEIYYVDVKEIRDLIEVNDDGVLETTKEGTDGYYKLINLLDGVLSDYTITDNDGNDISANEKRIYAPNIIAVLDGEAKEMTSGISDKLTDPYMELTDEIKEDSYNQFNKVLSYVSSALNTCTDETGC